MEKLTNAALATHTPELFTNSQFHSKKRTIWTEVELHLPSKQNDSKEIAKSQTRGFWRTSFPQGSQKSFQQGKQNGRFKWVCVIYTV